MDKNRAAILNHKETRFTLPIHLTSGVAGKGTWQSELFQISPFLLLGDEPLIAVTATESYMLTPECLPNEDSEFQEVTLVGRGVAKVLSHQGIEALIPWNLHLTYLYNQQNATLIAMLRPYVHLDRATGSVCAHPLMHYGLQVSWEPGWVSQGERWGVSPAGNVVVTPYQMGVDSVITTATYTLMADQTAPAAMLIMQGTKFEQAATTGQNYSQMQLQYPTFAQHAHSNSITVITDWRDGKALCKVHTSPSWQQAACFRSKPSQTPASDVVRSHVPGRYWYMIELTSSQLAMSLVLVVPFRYWPAAATYPVQAQFAQPLLSTDLGYDYIVAFNFISPHDFYRANDRDDILAEQAYIAHCLGELFTDPDLYCLAVAMTERLLQHQQPDGGFTFSISVNGERADYSDTNADVITCLLTLINSPYLDHQRQMRYEQAMLRSARHMLTFQDPSGFFWGRVERPGEYRYPQQPWFASYAIVSALDVARYLQFRTRCSCTAESNQSAQEAQFAGSAMSKPIDDVIDGPICTEAVPLLAAVERGLRWLCSVQEGTGAWRYDTTGSYADYDDLSNTSIAVWALSIATRLWKKHPEQQLWWQAATAGVRYLLTRELPLHSGQFAGVGIPQVEKLVYDYRLGFAFQEYLHTAQKVDAELTLPTAHASEKETALCTTISAALTRYLKHVKRIQGLGILTGGWASLFSLEHQCYLHNYSWFERGSEWHKYLFLGWQGKLALLRYPNE